MSSKPPQPPPPPPLPGKPAPPLKPKKGEGQTKSKSAAANPPPPPPPAPPSKTLPVASAVYDHVDADSPTSSFNTSAVDQSKKRNPFRDSYIDESEEPSSSSGSTKKTNPFRDSYQESEETPTSTSKKTNPFRDSYREDEAEAPPPSKKTNPFDIDALDSAQESGSSGKFNLVTSKKGVSRSNPIIAAQQASGEIDASEHGDNAGTSSEAVVLSSAGLFKGEPTNPIYHMNRFSDPWMIAFLCIHTGQFILLFTVGFQALQNGAFGVVVFLAFAVVVLVLLARYYTKKSHLSDWRNREMNDGKCTPQDEADEVPDIAVLCIATAAVTEGIIFAIFTAVSSGNTRNSPLNSYFFHGLLFLLYIFYKSPLLLIWKLNCSRYYSY